MPADALDLDEIFRPEIRSRGFVKCPHHSGFVGDATPPRALIHRVHRERRSRMTAEIRHCEQCDHEFEVEVSSAKREALVDGCAETTPDCGLTHPGEQVKVVREID
jgi:hypothetical protein